MRHAICNLAAVLTVVSLPAIAQVTLQEVPDGPPVTIKVSDSAMLAFAKGYNYERGRNVPQDYSKAMAFYHQAADAGHPLAEFRIGYLYEKGLGVEKDYTQARDWYQKAADAGIPTAKMRLALLPVSTTP